MLNIFGVMKAELKRTPSCRRAMQVPLTFIVFLIILIILISVLLIWNFSGIKIFDAIFGSTGTIINGTSGGAVNTLLP